MPEGRAALEPQEEGPVACPEGLAALVAAWPASQEGPWHARRAWRRWSCSRRPGGCPEGLAALVAAWPASQEGPVACLEGLAALEPQEEGPVACPRAWRCWGGIAGIAEGPW